MDKVTLRKVQLVELEILKEVKRVCEKYNISYWLDSGTALGAARHSGFIPWDDDLDIGMLRKDYDRFLSVAGSELGEKYVLQDWHRTEGHYFCFAKVRKKGTLLQENKAPRSADNGIYIDIFPYDVFPDSKLYQIQQHYPLDILKRAIIVKGGDRIWKTLNGFDTRRFIRYLPAIILSFFIGENAKDRFEKLQTKFNSLDNYSFYFPCGTEQYGNWLIERANLEHLDTIQFEDDVFPCPSNIDGYLTKAYGDYMTPPPEEKRSVGHSIIAVDFGTDD